MTSPSEEEAFAAAQAAEYGTYVAVQTILHDGVCAYNAGDPVPVSNVEAHGYLDAGLVAKVNDQAPETAAPPAPDNPTTEKE